MTLSPIARGTIVLLLATVFAGCAAPSADPTPEAEASESDGPSLRLVFRGAFADDGLSLPLEAEADLEGPRLTDVASLQDDFRRAARVDALDEVEHVRR